MRTLILYVMVCLTLPTTAFSDDPRDCDYTNITAPVCQAISSRHVCVPYCPGYNTEIKKGKCQECLCRTVAECSVTDDGSDALICECEAGWRGKHCNQDDDECVTIGCDENADCANTVGSYDCTCNSGWSGSGEIGDCSDVDECEDDTDDCPPAESNGICTDTDGSFTCSCNDGYELLTDGDGEKYCEDIDECAGEPAPCDTNAACTDSDGSFSCDCNDGYSGSGFNCTDTDECLDEPCDVNADCDNTEGSFDCECNSGWSGDGFDCTDVDECEDGLDDCDQCCTDTDGSYTCGCYPGYSIAEGTDNTCIDVDECSDYPSPCGSLSCTDTEGGFNCNPSPTCD